MNIAVPKEIIEGEKRVALVPDIAKRLIGDGLTVSVEAGAGTAAGFPDEAYKAIGAEIIGDPATLWGKADVVLKIQMPSTHPGSGTHEAAWARPGVPLIGLFLPLSNLEGVRELMKAKATTFSLDALPRITRAQSMDVLSSMSTVMGYKAVLLAAAHLGKFFPMLVTAAGTLAPGKCLVLGAGVAGLQAIATARRLGAVVQAFDVRAAAKEQVESLGARFIEDRVPSTDAEDAGGYAKELSEEQNKRNMALIHKNIVDVDVVITTALIPGRPAPTLITDEMVDGMRPGSVIVDLAAEAGGNCTLTQPGRDIVHGGVTILGPRNLAASMPTHASQMFAKNITTFLRHMISDGALNVDLEDEIIGATCITKDGEVVHRATKEALDGGKA